jgi:hypothetical protein
MAGNKQYFIIGMHKKLYLNMDKNIKCELKLFLPRYIYLHSIICSKLVLTNLKIIIVLEVKSLLRIRT